MIVTVEDVPEATMSFSDTLIAIHRIPQVVALTLAYEHADLIPSMPITVCRVRPCQEASAMTMNRRDFIKAQAIATAAAQRRYRTAGCSPARMTVVPRPSAGTRAYAVSVVPAVPCWLGCRMAGWWQRRAIPIRRSIAA